MEHDGTTKNQGGQQVKHAVVTATCDILRFPLFCKSVTSKSKIHLSPLLSNSSLSPLSLIVQDPWAPRPYLFSDGQNMYNRSVLVCVVNVCMLANLDRRLILRYQIL